MFLDRTPSVQQGTTPKAIKRASSKVPFTAASIWPQVYREAAPDIPGSGVSLGTLAAYLSFQHIADLKLRECGTGCLGWRCQTEPGREACLQRQGAEKYDVDIDAAVYRYDWRWKMDSRLITNSPSKVGLPTRLQRDDKNSFHDWALLNRPRLGKDIQMDNIMAQLHCRADMEVERTLAQAEMRANQQCAFAEIPAEQERRDAEMLAEWECAEAQSKAWVALFGKRKDVAIFQGGIDWGICEIGRVPRFFTNLPLERLKLPSISISPERHPRCATVFDSSSKNETTHGRTGVWEALLQLTNCGSMTGTSAIQYETCDLFTTGVPPFENDDNNQGDERKSLVLVGSSDGDKISANGDPQLFRLIQTQLRRFSSIFYEHRPTSITLLEYELRLSWQIIRALETQSNLLFFRRDPQAPFDDPTQCYARSNTAPTPHRLHHGQVLMGPGVGTGRRRGNNVKHGPSRHEIKNGTISIKSSSPTLPALNNTRWSSCHSPNLQPSSGAKFGERRELRLSLVLLDACIARHGNTKEALEEARS
ncbi:hypothetical protein PG984_016220 [Apiospora sp. TS-2023a]